MQKYATGNSAKKAVDECIGEKFWKNFLEIETEVMSQ